MKNLLVGLFLFVLLVFFGCTKNSQERDLNHTTSRSVLNANIGPFYYSGGEKIYLKEDTSIIAFKTASADLENTFNKLQSTLSSFKAVKYMAKLENGCVEIKVDGDIKSILKALKDEPTVVYAWHSLRLENKEVQNDIPFIPTGEVLFLPKKGISTEEVLTKFNLTSSKVIRKKEQAGFEQILLQSDDIFNIANSIHTSGLVEWCHPNFWVPQTIFYHPSDWYYADQFYFKNWGQYGGTVGMDMNIEPAWDLTKGNSSIKIAVVDDGVEAHEDLPASRILSGYTPRNPSYGYGAPTASGKHGECVAGIIAATQDNDNPSASMYTISGAAPNCTIIPINIFYDGLETPADNAAGITWAWQNGNADIINNSWGYGTGVYFSVIQSSIDNARNYGRSGKGCIVTAASGNSNAAVSFPANGNGVITVGAIDRRGFRSTYSNYGPSMDLVGYSSYELAPLGDVMTIDRMGNPGYLPGAPTRPYYAGFGGTSAACPQVSGIAALMLSINSGLTEAQVTSILQSTAIDMGTSGFDNYYGYGRLNAYDAVYQASITPTTW